MRLDEGLVSKEHVVARDDGAARNMRTAAEPRERVGEDRPAEHLRETDDRGGQASRIRARPAHDRSGAGATELAGQPLDGVRIGDRQRLHRIDPRPGVGPTLPIRRIKLLTHRCEWLAQREVEMDGARTPGGGRRIGAARQRPEVDGGLARRLVAPHLDKPLGEGSVQLDLVDRLTRADLPQLGRAVRGHHDQGHARFVRLDHGREEVGGGGPRGARHGHRLPAHLRDPERDIAGGALVDHRVRVDALLIRQRQRQRGIPRSRTRHGVLHPAADQLVHERLDRGVRPVDGDHAGGMRRAKVVFVPGFMQRGDAWAPVAERVAERYPTACLDFASHSFEPRLGELREAAGPGDVPVGYSMGGRLVLHLAVREPDRFAALALVGASAGIDDQRERADRAATDEELAAWMERTPIDEVVARWEALSIFATQAPELVAAQRPGRLSHDPKLLALLLRSAGQAAVPSLWDQLERLDLPILAVAGERDEPYLRAARRMALFAPRIDPRVVFDAGHAAHLEDPDAFAALLLEFLDENLG